MSTSSSRKIPTVALTGGIASGKSIVANEFAKLGVPVIDTDELARTVPMLRPGDVAAVWLIHFLANGPRPATEVVAAAAREGIPDRTLDRVKASQDIKSHLVVVKTGERVWFWYDPAAPWPKDAPFKRPYLLEPLEL